MRSGACRQCVDLDLAIRWVRIERGKGQKDRRVCLSRTVVAALRAYLAVRGPAATDHLFLFRHRPLSRYYCWSRLRTYGRGCGIAVTPHQLRHSFGTLLLNAGAPVMTVQTLLGHRRLETTLVYAHLYDGTIAADYDRAMATIERVLNTDSSPGKAEIEETVIDPTGFEPLLTALTGQTLTEADRRLLAAVGQAMMALANGEKPETTPEMTG